jgi:uncharacterized protein (TIGR00369 family)
MQDLLALGKLSLSRQPFSCYMETIFEKAEQGDVVLSLKIKDEFKQNYGAVHGGVISYMIDAGLSYAAASEIGDCVTSELKINYLRAATGEKIIARAQSIFVGSRQVVCECKVFSWSAGKEESLVAVGIGTVNRIVDNKRG